MSDQDQAQPRSVAERIAESQRGIDLAIVQQHLNAAMGELAVAKVTLAIGEAGGITAHPNQVREDARIRMRRIELLGALVEQLEAGSDPLPNPSELQVLRGKLR